MPFILSGGEELKRVIRSLTGKEGKAALRKGLRAGAKIVQKELKSTVPVKTGAMKRSVRVRAMKRRKGRIGVTVQIFAARKGQPYPMFLEGGVKQQPKAGRVRKVTKRITVDGRSRKVTDEAASHAYHSLAWRIEPQRTAEKAFKRVSSAAMAATLAAIKTEIEKTAGTK